MLPPVFQTLGLALAIGFLVGVERGWKQRAEGEGQRAAGLRTYTLIGLLGGVAGQIALHYGALAFAAIALAFGAAFGAFKFLEHRAENDFSVTGLIAGLLVFALGGYVQAGDAQAGAAAGVIVAAILAFKAPLHDWLRAVTWPELRSALLILAMTLVVLPLLPDRPLDPYGAFKPRELWLLTIFVAAASFAGYAALRAFGETKGLYVGAAAGAMVSSTIVTLDLARRVRDGGAHAAPAAAAATLASAVMLARIAGLSAAFAAPTFPALWPALAAAIAATAAVFAALLLLADRSRQAIGALKGLSSPLDIAAVARFALILCVLTVAARAIAHFYGGGGTLAFAATAGLVDVDAVTLAVGGLVKSGAAPLRIAAEAILLAALMDTLSKTAIAFVAGGAKFGAFYGVGSAALIAAGAGAFALTGGFT